MASSATKFEGVAHVNNPNLPQFRFEYHTEAQTVYVFRLGGEAESRDAVAFNVPDIGTAINSVMIWSRGYNERSTEDQGQDRELVRV